MKLMLATALTTSGAFTVIPHSADAATTEQTNQNGELVVLNESTLQYNVNKGEKIKVDANGIASLIDKDGNFKEQLPSESTDKDGKKVNLSYVANDKGAMIQVKLKNTEETVGTATRSLSGPVKCYLGTASGAIGGGLAGGAAGSVIPILGTAGGGILGAVGGGMGGAAASC